MVLGCGRSRLGLESAVEIGGTTAGSGAVAGDGSGGGGGSGGSGGAGNAGKGNGGSGSGGRGGTGGHAAGMAGAGGRAVDPSVQPPSLRLPQNGRATGSVWVERARRPRFAWDAQPGMTFEIEVDDSCEVGALETCEFSSPEWTATDLSVNDITPPRGLPVSESAPVGRRYFWRVRACTSAACSPWSMVRYVDVGRQRSDFDGDGYADVILSNWGNSATKGRILVGFGPTPSSRMTILEDDTTRDTPDHFGQVAAPLGDMDGDGFADLLVTAPGDSISQPGKARVFYGAIAFPLRRESLGLEADGEGDRISGVAIPAFDVDADGMQDFVLDSYPTDPRLYLSLGRGVRRTPISVVRSGEVLYGMSAGDVTGDGYSDVFAFSVLWDGDYVARYDLLPGSPSGLGAPEPMAASEGSMVPEWTILGDVNGDGFSDFCHAVNDLGDEQSSHIEVSLGGETPVLDPMFTWGAGFGDTAMYVEQAGPISAGDINGDGFDDSLVGISWHISGVVQANLYLGGQGSRSAPDAVYAFQSEFLLFISTGLPFAMGDVNGDGSDDVFLAEDFDHTGKLFFGGPALDTDPDDELRLPFPE